MFIFANKTVQSVPWNKGKLTGQKLPLRPASRSGTEGRRTKEGQQQEYTLTALPNCPTKWDQLRPCGI